MERKLLLKLKQKFVWARDRCTNPNSQRWKTYGGRWIRFLRESFDDFYRDMWDSFIEHVEKYGMKDTTIDRIDINWDYCKENCRWATRHEQYEKRTTNRDILISWVNLWNRTWIADMLWINPSTLKWRLDSWWSVEKAIATKVRNPCKQIEYKWKIYKSIKEFASEFWLSYTRTKRRIGKWWDLDKVIYCPKKWDFLYDKQHKDVSVW